MIRLIAVAFIVAIVLPAQAMPVAPLHEPDGVITEVAYGCLSVAILISAAQAQADPRKTRTGAS